MPAPGTCCWPGCVSRRKHQRTFAADERRAPSGAIAYVVWRWRHRRCPQSASGRHVWLYAGATNNPQTGQPYPYDRECVACGIED